MRTFYFTGTVFCLSAFLFFASQPLLAQDDSSERGANDRRIQRGDLLIIGVFREPDLSVTQRVQASGIITYPLLKSVEVAGKTPAEVAKQLREALGKDYLVHPQVSVDIKEFAKRTFNVIGQVAKGGSFELPPEEKWTIIDGIAAAGGFTDKAAKSKIEFTRDGKTKRYRYDELQKTSDPAKVIYLKPGDLINVRESFL